MYVSFLFPFILVNNLQPTAWVYSYVFHLQIILFYP